MTLVDHIGEEGVGLDYFDPKEFAARTQIEDEHYWHLHRREVLLEVLRRVCPDRSTPLIEVGCGIGTVTTHLNAHGFSVDYCDVHRTGLEHAEARAERRLGKPLERRFIRFDISSGPIPGDYGGVLMFDVLEHLEDHERVLANLRESLAGRPDGFVFLTVPAFPLLWSPWDEIEKHKRRYTKASLVAAARAAGFRVEQLRYFFFPLFFAALGVKGLRTLRDRVAPAPAATEIGELTEAKSMPLVNSVMLRLLAPERAWLGRADLGLGTSLLAVLRAG